MLYHISQMYVDVITHPDRYIDIELVNLWEFLS